MTDSEWLRDQVKEYEKLLAQCLTVCPKGDFSDLKEQIDRRLRIADELDTNSQKQPMQPIYIDSHGYARFKENRLVRYLLEASDISMNDLAIIDFPQEDREQFSQLIGCTVGSFGTLSYVRPEVVRKADIIVNMLERRVG